MSEVTRILAAIERGDVRAVDELFPLVYQEQAYFLMQFRVVLIYLQWVFLFRSNSALYNTGAGVRGGRF